jgi:hypothetical protein
MILFLLFAPPLTVNHSFACPWYFINNKNSSLVSGDECQVMSMYGWKDVYCVAQGDGCGGSECKSLISFETLFTCGTPTTPTSPTHFLLLKPHLFIGTGTVNDNTLFTLHYQVRKTRLTGGTPVKTMTVVTSSSQV